MPPKDYVCAICTQRYEYIPHGGCSCTDATFTIYFDGKGSEKQREEIIKRVKNSKSSTQKSSSSGGCYIATAVYQNYDHPKVLTLRRFRDTVLLRSKAGEVVVRIYYRYSPTLVKSRLFRNILKGPMRLILNKFTSCLEKMENRI